MAWQQKMVIHQGSVNPSFIVRLLAAVAFLLVLASAGVQLTAYFTGYDTVYELLRLFYVDAEMNIPTFFSALLLFFAASLLAVITALKRKQRSFHVLYWAILSIGFLFMAIDEVACFHERLIWPLRTLLGGGHLGVFAFAWVIPGIVLVFGLGLFFLRFLLRLPAKTRLTFLMAAALYVGGAIGFELIGGRYAELNGVLNLTYGMLALVEESLEMAGVIVFIWALLVYLVDTYKISPAPI